MLVCQLHVYLYFRFRNATIWLQKYTNQVILPEALVEQDSIEVLSVVLSNGNEEQAQRWRDLLKKVVIKSDGKAVYILIGVENQAEVHYAMPIRTMLYDALNYCSQAREIATKHRKQHDKMQAAEFLLGFRKDDKLIPVITITVYWGSDESDAPINLVAPYRMNEADFEKFQTTLGKILKFLKYAKECI